MRQRQSRREKSATILEQLADFARERVRRAREKLPLEEVRGQALALQSGDFAFERVLAEPGVSLICECKRASPSKGVIAEEFPYMRIAREYERAGASAISVLTEPKWFLGSDRYLKDIAKNVHIPCLRKDFVVDEYMLYQAKLLGASAVLLICAILSFGQLKEYMAICDELGLSALVEIHDEEEADMALKAGARIVGVNNRNLRDFTIDTGLSGRLRARIPRDILFVSESGVKSAENMKELEALGADAALIGEVLMRAPDKKAKLDELRKGFQRESRVSGGGRYDKDKIMRPDAAL